VTGSYVTAFFGAIGVLIALAALFLLLGQPQRTAESIQTKETEHGVT
jgi:hypothetical protein